MGHLIAGIFLILTGILNLYFWHDLEIRRVKRECSIQRIDERETIIKKLTGETIK